MRPDLSQMEFHEMFISNIHHLRFALEEMGKMVEARLENLSRYVCENELNEHEFNDSRIEIQKAINGFKYSVKSLCENLKNEFKISLDKIDPEYEKSQKLEEFKKSKHVG